MGNTEKLMDNQNIVVAQIADISEKLNDSAALMEQVSSALNSAADDQHSIIEEIAADIASITDEAEKSIGESEKASEAARSSTNMLIENNNEVKNMVAAMNEITEASHKIESIIKAIEDIAFQTNILALNAAVEAARAGAAGKGFAVVADEVRNLATKSAEAASNTSALIQTTIEAVDKGTLLAGNVAKRMDDVIALSKKSTEQSADIIRLTESQASSAKSADERMQKISESTAGNLKTAEESAQIAHSVSEQVRKMNMIVKSIKS
ncbi:MAG: methyl-accepting chemotaxis protein [Oscillospiraceae bacterium]|nr:methyl-accepting chemotaxis protein [Oscillospiraceae bacterium]